MTYAPDERRPPRRLQREIHDAPAPRLPTIEEILTWSEEELRLVESRIRAIRMGDGITSK